MTHQPLAQVVSSMRGTLQSVETQLARGDIPAEGIADLKRAIDDIRLQVWAIMAAAAEDGPMSLERFRLRRALEVCHTVVGDLGRGAIGYHHRELADLRTAAQQLVAAIDRADATAVG